MSAACERHAHFHEKDTGLPIAETPAPVPCPFCGAQGDDIVIVLKDGGGRVCDAVCVECCRCGVEAAYASTDPERGLVTRMDCIMEATRLWNTRAVPGEEVRQ